MYVYCYNIFKFRNIQNPGLRGTMSDFENNELVRRTRENIRGYIVETCGRFRVLDMTRPINLNDIYTDIYILEKISGKQRLSIKNSPKNANANVSNSERLSLERELERIPGLDAVRKHSKLIILGKPGAGKTIFLKSLALKCIDGQFEPDLIPLFIELKDFEQALGQPDFSTYIIQLLSNYSQKKIAKNLLEQGKLLILLDGLDEVQNNSTSILSQIKNFTNLYHRNKFVITCRTAAQNYVFQNFTEVEVADFDFQQIAIFTNKWFTAKNDIIKSRLFNQKLENNKRIQELATNPLLLTLLCLVFGESGTFPANRSQLYKEGLDVLLKKWDKDRNIERGQVYRQFSLDSKKNLLSLIAFESFNQGKYFFQQTEIEQIIKRYIIQNPSDTRDNSGYPPPDSEAVLKSIEAQHGLLVERSRGIYSFSHLTFQEYFTARHITYNSQQENAFNSFNTLVSHIKEQRWQEVFVLTSEMLPSAENFLLLIKEYTDALLAKNENLQRFLTWVNKKSNSVDSEYKPAVARGFYFELQLAVYLVQYSQEEYSNLFDYLYIRLFQGADIAAILDLDFQQQLSYFNFTLSQALNLKLYLVPRLFYLDWVLKQAQNFTLYDLPQIAALAPFFNQIHNLNRSYREMFDFSRIYALNMAIDMARYLNKKLELQPYLEQLQNQLRSQLAAGLHITAFTQWWSENGTAWTEQLNNILVEHRNIGHDWQFSKSEKQLLREYYNANKTLVYCLNSDCSIRQEVRQQIEDMLFQPSNVSWQEICTTLDNVYSDCRSLSEMCQSNVLQLIKQRIYNLTNLLRLNYEKLNEHERELTISSSPNVKNEARQRINNEIIPTIQEIYTKWDNIYSYSRSLSDIGKLDTMEFKQQRLADLEDLLELDYQNLTAYETELRISGDIVIKNALNQRIKREIMPRIREKEREYLNLLVELTNESEIAEPEAQSVVTTIINNTSSIINDGMPEKIVQKLKEILDKLNEPGTAAAAKAKVVLNLIPGIFAYEIELDTQNTLLRLFRPLKELFAKYAKKKS
jgi:hypothetical protein